MISKKLFLVFFIFLITVIIVDSIFFLTKYILLEKEAEKYIPKEELIYNVPGETSITSGNQELIISITPSVVGGITANEEKVFVNDEDRKATINKNKDKKIAIVMDDLGIRTVRYYFLDLIENKLNLAVIPGQEHSQDIVKYYKMNKNFELLMHMPMEPFQTKEDRESSHSKTVGYKYIVTPSDNKKAINTKLNEAFDALLGEATISGISNHMGSYVTSSRDMVNSIVGWSKKNKLYVFDSLTSPSSVFYEQSRKAKVKSAYNQVFLDGIDDPDYIKKQLSRAKKIADDEGQVIAIGHIDRQYTMEVLFEWMPTMVEEGYTFVFVSELAR